MRRADPYVEHVNRMFAAMENVERKCGQCGDRAHDASSECPVGVAEHSEDTRQRVQPGDTVLATRLDVLTHGRVRWRVEDCSCGLCASDRYVALDEPSVDGGRRHIARTMIAREHDVRGAMARRLSEYLIQSSVPAIAAETKSCEAQVGAYVEHMRVVSALLIGGENGTG